MSSLKRYQFAFSGKEIFIIFSMLIFISILIFTLGIMYGKSGGFSFKMSSLVSESDFNDDDFKGDDFQDTLSENEDIQELDLDDDMDAFESDSGKPSKVETKEHTSGEKVVSPESKETKLSFYKDLTKNDKIEQKSSEDVIDTAPTKKIGKYPMISEDVLRSNKGKYTVQVAAYIKEVDAESKALLLKKICCSSAYYVKSEVPGKGIWYQVRIGFFDKLSNARDFAQDLKKKKKIAEYLVKIVR